MPAPNNCYSMVGLRRPIGCLGTADSRRASSGSEAEHVQFTIARHINLTLDDGGFGVRSSGGVFPWPGGTVEKRRAGEIGRIERLPEWRSAAPASPGWIA